MVCKHKFYLHSLCFGVPMFLYFLVGFFMDPGSVADHSERTFYKELVKVIEVSDVILEVLDARDPLGTRCLDMEKMVRKSGAEKHLVLLLNKIGMFCCTSFMILCFQYICNPSLS